jgi:hypothetical protein
MGARECCLRCFLASRGGGEARQLGDVAVFLFFLADRGGREER